MNKNRIVDVNKQQQHQQPHRQVFDEFVICSLLWNSAIKHFICGFYTLMNEVGGDGDYDDNNDDGYYYSRHCNMPKLKP